MYIFLGGVSGQKIDTMKENALSFQKTVATNIASFHNVDTVYLDEAIKEEFIGNIKSPFGGGNCDVTQSKVNFVEGKPYVTLKCGDYLIDKAVFNDKDSVDLFKVTAWSEKEIKGDDVETIELYNCTKDGKEVYDQYYEELYFIVKMNSDNQTNYYFANDIPKDKCTVVKKNFYRHKEKVTK